MERKAHEKTRPRKHNQHQPTPRQQNAAEHNQQKKHTENTTIAISQAESTTRFATDLHGGHTNGRQVPRHTASHVSECHTCYAATHVASSGTVHQGVQIYCAGSDNDDELMMAMMATIMMRMRRRSKDHILNTRISQMWGTTLQYTIFILHCSCESELLQWTLRTPSVSQLQKKRMRSKNGCRST